MGMKDGGLSAMMVEDAGRPSPIHRLLRMRARSSAKLRALLRSIPRKARGES